MNPAFLVLMLALLLAAAAGPARAASVYLTSGDRVTGKLIRFQADEVSLDTTYAGTLRIGRSAIAAIASDDVVVTVVLKDQTRISGRLMVTWPTQMYLLQADPYRYTALSLEQIDAIYPGDDAVPDEDTTADVFVWSGRFNFGLENKSGNSDKSSLDIDGNTTGRSEVNRVVGRFEVNLDDASNERVTQNAQAQLRHDRFRNKKLFEYTSGFVEYDEFKSLNLRLLLTTGPGYQFIESENRNFGATLGVSYLYEDYSGPRETSAAAGTWSLNYDQYLYGRFTQFFHFQQGTLNFSDLSQLILQTRTGFRFPFRENFNTTLQFDFDYESKPAPGRVSADTTFKLTIGYNW